MKYNVPIPCFFKNTDFCEAVKKVKELGFSAIETYRWQELDTEKVRSACDEYDVRLLSICTTDFELTKKNNDGVWLSGLSETIKASKILGNDLIITQSGADTGESRKVQHERIVNTLKKAVPLLGESKKTVIIEPLNTIINHKDCYLSTSREAFDIVKEVNSPFVKVLFDIYHQQITEGNIINNITENIDLIAHFHAACTPGRNELWLGENNYDVIFGAIDKTGYNGFCGIEYNPLMEPTESLQEFKRRYMN